MSVKKEQAVLRDEFNTLIGQISKALNSIEGLYDKAKQTEDINLQEWIKDYLFKKGCHATFFVARADVKELK